MSGWRGTRPAPQKGRTDVSCCERLIKGCLEGWQKFNFSDVVDVVADQSLHLLAVRTLQWQEAAHIKWLKQVG
jgi:hypothetical protein